MRISTAWSQQLSVTAMLNQQAKMNKTQMQLSSGLKNLSPSDDPIAATKVLDLQSSLTKTDQFQENIKAATTSNTLESSTLTSAIDIIQNARDLTVQALNSGSLKDSDKQALGYQMQEALKNMVSLGNTTNASGEYLFSGFQTKTPPFLQNNAVTPPTFTYQGSPDQRMIQIANGRQIASGDPGSTVFSFTSPVDGSNQNIFNSLSKMAEALTNPSATTESTLRDALSELDAGMNQIGDAQSKSGARLAALENQQQQHDKYTVDTKSMLSDIQDLDYASAITQFSQQEMALQAAQQSFSKIQKLSLFNYL